MNWRLFCCDVQRNFEIKRNVLEGDPQRVLVSCLPKKRQSVELSGASGTKEEFVLKVSTRRVEC